METVYFLNTVLQDVNVSVSHPVMSDTSRPHGPPGFSVPGILQARILGWVAIQFSRGSAPPRDQTLSPALPDFFTVWATSEIHKV